MNISQIKYFLLTVFFSSVVAWYFFSNNSNNIQNAPSQNLQPKVHTNENSSIDIQKKPQDAKQQNSDINFNFIGDKKIGFESTTQESPLQKLPLIGTIPHWLKGIFINTGPAQYEMGPTKAAYWFNGLAMLHAFYCDGANLSYQSSFLDSIYYQRCKRNGKFDSSMSTEKQKGFFSRLANAALGKPEPFDNGNVNIAKINDTFIALTETTLGVQFNPYTLKTIGSFDLNSYLEGHLTTAQFLYDHHTKAWYNYLINFGNTSSYLLYKIGTDNTPQEITSFPVKTPAYMRSFAMTKKYLILIEIPFVVNPLDLLLGAGSFIEKIQWKPELGTKFIVVQKHTGKLIGNFTTKAPFLIFNTINAFEEGEHIIIDAITYSNTEIIKYIKLDALRSDNPKEFEASYITRFNINQNNGSVDHQTLSSQPVDFPTMNTARAMGHYKYVYGVSAADPNKFPHQLIKCNLKTGTSKTWTEQGCYANKPLFVPAPGAIKEDNGIVFAVVFNSITKKSFLLILDAQKFTELGRAELPHYIPLGLSGIFDYAK